MMRIITGKAKGVKLLTLEGDNTRPTSERAKEAVFSMLAFDIEGREVLDLYAGSGQMGLEALSRGAMRATFIDNNASAVDIIKKNIIKTKLIDGAICLKSDVNDYLNNAAFAEVDAVKDGFVYHVDEKDICYASNNIGNAVSAMYASVSDTRGDE